MNYRLDYSTETPAVQADGLQVNTGPARGMRDFLPEDVRRRQYVIGVIADVYQKYAFEPLETPAVENLETLQGKYGEEGDRLIFKILKRGEGAETGQADLALRYDLTVPLARVVAEYRAQAAEVLQALPGAAGVARRSSAEGPLPRVLPVRRRCDRLDLDDGRSGVAVRGGRRVPRAWLQGLPDRRQSPQAAERGAGARRRAGRKCTARRW